MSKSSVFCAFCVVVALLVCASMSDAAQPSAAKLSQMGLSGATVVSDSVAMEVRGFGYRGKSKTKIYGKSEVEYEGSKGEAEASNGYYYSGKGSASGKNLSIAGEAELEVEINGGLSVDLDAKFMFAGGVSSVKTGGGRRGGH
jgi:hypothetical protein